jgi:cell division protein FtsN
VAARRGKSQARRNSGNTGGLPGWAWLILGIVIALLAMLALPRLLKSDGSDGFILPRPNPDAQPSSSSNAGDDADLPAPVADAPKAGAKDADDQERQYDFYTVLPGQEVAMSDAELAASARAEAARQQQLAQQQQAAAATPSDDDAPPASAATTPAAPAAPAPATPVATGTDKQAPYVLQAGAFAASGDAEAVKARIALLGLNARVESASINGKTVYRVRMGPYGTATELAAAKGKLASGGLPAMAIKVK